MKDKTLRSIIFTLLAYFGMKTIFPGKGEIGNEITNFKDEDLVKIKTPYLNRILKRIRNLILRDKALRAAIATLFGTVILNEFLDDIIIGLIQCCPSILAASKIQRRELTMSEEIVDLLVQPDIYEVKDLLVRSSLSTQEKLEVFLRYIRMVLTSLEKRKRIYFLIKVLALLIFLLKNNLPLLTVLWSAVRELLKSPNLIDDLDEF